MATRGSQHMRPLWGAYVLWQLCYFFAQNTGKVGLPPFQLPSEDHQ